MSQDQYSKSPPLYNSLHNLFDILEVGTFTRLITPAL